MARYVTRVRTPWPTEKAFAYMADLRNFAEWDPGVNASVQVEGNSPSLGATYDVTVASIGRDLTLRYELTQYVDGERLTATAKSSTLTSVDTVEVAPEGDGSIVTYDAELTLNGILSVGDVFLRLAFGRIGDRAAAGMRTALAGEDAGA